MNIDIPRIDPDADTLTAALAYAAAGLYVGPVKRGTKHPGSVLGDGWQALTSTDPKVISSWFAGTDHGVFIHAGRSGLIVADVDTPENLHPLVRRAVDELEPPFQTTREGEAERGHYLFAQPGGRMLGNSLGGLASGWGEMRGHNGVIVVAPSEHADAGGLYQWQRVGPVPTFPDYCAEQVGDAIPSDAACSDGEVTAFLDAHTEASRPGLVGIHVSSFQSRVEAGESRHQTMCGPLAGAMKEAAAGLVDARAAADTLEGAFREVATSAPVGPKQGKARTAAQARSEWRGLLSWAVAQGKGADPEQTRARVAEKVPDAEEQVAGLVAPGKAPETGDPLTLLGDLLGDLRGWQDLPDPTHVVVALAAAAGRHEDGEPCWLLLVAPPSSGKTEAVRVLDDTADARMDEVTPAGLLGWSKGKTVKPSGVLTRIGPRALLTIGDLSTLLATSDRGGRDQVFALLRRAYDGHASRDISPPGKVAEGLNERLEWSGRLTVIGCVTGAIDRFTAHADQLGARWLYVRLPERGTAQKRRAAALARRGGLAERRAAARSTAASLLASARLPGELPDDLADQIEDAALVTAWGRGAVPRNGYGRRDIEGVPVVEEPMRLVQQLGALARGVLALGLPLEAAEAITRRVALDSMPEARQGVLAALSTGELLATAGVARAADLHRHVARFQLEELAAIGVVEHDRGDSEEDEITGTVHWSLAGDDGALIAQVFGEHKRSGGWHEKWVLTPTSPPDRGEETPPTGSTPTLRATPATPACPTCGGPIEPMRAAGGMPCLSCHEGGAA